MKKKQEDAAAEAPKQLRQGDVLLVRVERMPTSAVKPVEKGLLARGETSGHGHFATGDCEVMEDSNGDMYIKTGFKAAEVQHLLESSGVWTKEHHKVDLEKDSTYKVVRQVEYNAYAKAIRQVKD